MSSAGNYLLISCIVFNILALIWHNSKNSITSKKVFFCIACILPVLAFLLLEYAFIISDFTLRLVFFYSSTNLPLIYKIASGWASHESSMLLWLAMLSAVSLSLLVALKRLVQAQGMMITMASFVQLLFCVFIVKTSNPFDLLSVDTKQGMGMNPMLQDMAVAIHPPILYMGFVSLFGIFLCSLLILQRPEFKTPLFLVCRKYSLIALAMLTMGIGLGGWWAYRELGWGGFWFFDPVENISLLPWISCLIFHHYLIFVINDQRFIRSALFWGIFAFLTTLYGFFFIRSGIVSSVHSFAFSPEKGINIIMICLCLTVLSYLVYGFGIRHFSQSALNVTVRENKGNDLQQQLVKYGNLFWIAAIFILLVAIIYPIYYSILRETEIAIDLNYYYKVFVPVFIPILLLAGIAPCLRGVDFRGVNFIRNFILLISATLATIVVVSVKEPGIIITLVLIAGIFLIFSSIDYLINVARIFSRKPESRQIAVFLGHFGAGLLTLAICINVIFSTEVKFIGGKGDNVSGEDLVVTLDDIKFAEGDVYYRQITKFNIQDSLGNMVLLRPENRLYKVENSVSQEADIFSFITHDLYAVITSVKNKVVNAEIHYKPMISFIWFAVLLISLGFAIRLLKRN